ncbi:hypothetical protein Taro_011263 [Colocasia esculenta]|uniref:DUF1677 family protein n=1 Tax=Colocasia esculenta TaxID=4460 RepID=A0A843U5T1_COLES|nr:hypothetical protein [Colocasia esculenta]
MQRQCTSVEPLDVRAREALLRLSCTFRSRGHIKPGVKGHPGTIHFVSSTARGDQLTRRKAKHSRDRKDQSLRRAISEILEDTGSIVEDFQVQQASKNSSEPQMIDCECCGMSEECTPTYIARIKEFYCGKWVCGLCSEAVKEQVKKKPMESMQEALESHMALCMKFNRTIRINPKLSLASSMRDIARRSSQRRTSKDLFASRIARTSSCGARIAL